MDIKCWGSRGSISVSGKQYEKYGGETTCIEITAKTGETIIVDAGTGIRALGNSFIDRNITEYFLLFTHVHWDHILGIAFFKPFQYSHVTVNMQDRMFAGMDTRKVMENVLQAPFFPVTLDDFKASIKFDKTLVNKFTIGSIEIATIPTSHPDGGLGYRFTEDGKSFVFLTDNELGFSHDGGAGLDDYIDFSKNADLLFHDAEYTADEYKRRTSWGHSSIEDVISLAEKAGVKKLGLFHINQDRTDSQEDKLVAQCKKTLKAHKSSMDCFAVACLDSFHL